MVFGLGFPPFLGGMLLSYLSLKTYSLYVLCALSILCVQLSEHEQPWTSTSAAVSVLSDVF